MYIDAVPNRNSPPWNVLKSFAAEPMAMWRRFWERFAAEMKISRRSSVQQKLWDLFDLGSIEQRLPYT